MMRPFGHAQQRRTASVIELRRQLAAAVRDRDEMAVTLKAAQQRCTALLERARQAERRG